MAECHPVGFRWVMEAKRRGATVIHVDPRFTRTSAVADVHVAIRPGTDIAFLGGIIRYVLENERYFEEYVVRYTNAPTILREDFRDAEDLDGIFSGYDAKTGKYAIKTDRTAHASEVREDGPGLLRRRAGRLANAEFGDTAARSVDHRALYRRQPPGGASVQGTGQRADRRHAVVDGDHAHVIGAVGRPRQSDRRLRRGLARDGGEARTQRLERKATFERRCVKMIGDHGTGACCEHGELVPVDVRPVDEAIDPRLRAEVASRRLQPAGVPSEARRQRREVERSRRAVR
jgi:hypothetical protein